MKYFDAKAIVAGLIAALLLVAAIYVGSRGLKDFDHALTTYAFGSIFAAFAVTYRYALWAQRPPTWMYLKRGWQLFWKKSMAPLTRARGDAQVPTAPAGKNDGPVKNAFSLSRMLLESFVLQKFIGKRSYERWIMHACLSWGGMLAFAMTFPLVFGWVHFDPIVLANNEQGYRVMAFGFAIDQFDLHGIKALLAFNLLNFSAVLMLVGLALSVRRRMNDSAELATQTFGDDVLPLFLLFAVCATGLLLTVSSRFMAGHGFAFIAMAHAASVIAVLLYMPFGKLFHIFQRTASLGVSFYKKTGATGPRAHCLRCGEDFASQMHVDDLKTVLDQLGFDYRFQTTRGEVHYQDICPACRRRLLSLNQGKSVGR